MGDALVRSTHRPANTELPPGEPLQNWDADVTGVQLACASVNVDVASGWLWGGRTAAILTKYSWPLLTDRQFEGVWVSA
jgi:hypothetical protein